MHVMYSKVVYIGFFVPRVGTGSAGLQLLTFLSPGSRGAKGETLPGQSTLKWSRGFSDE
jgi:hypothetical protein